MYFQAGPADRRNGSVHAASRGEYIMNRILKGALAAAALLTQSASMAAAADVTLNALFMKQAAYSEDDVRAMTADFEKANAGVKAMLDARATASKNPIILIIRIAISCLHGAPVFIPGLRDCWRTPYSYLRRRSVTGITRILFFKVL